MDQKIFKLKGLNYFIVSVDSVESAAVIGRLNNWGVTAQDIEEVTDKSSLPTEPDQVVAVVAPPGIPAIHVYLTILEELDNERKVRNVRTQQEMVEWFQQQPDKRIAKKTAQILARKATQYEIIKTVLANGHQETDRIAEPDYMIVINPGGEQYTMPMEDFEARYEYVSDFSEFTSVYSAKGRISYIRIDEDMTFVAPWKSEMTILAGGVICSPYPEGETVEVYGIGGKEFEETYTMIDFIIKNW